MPTEALALSDQRRIELALEELGYSPVTVPLPVLRRLYPMCREAGFDITVTLVHREHDWVIPGHSGRFRRCGLRRRIGNSAGCFQCGHYRGCLHRQSCYGGPGVHRQPPRPGRPGTGTGTGRHYGFLPVPVWNLLPEAGGGSQQPAAPDHLLAHGQLKRCQMV